MTVSPGAGKPAEASMLVNVPQLVTTYYTEAPDPAVPEQRVAFGTSGHRGSAFDKAFNEGHLLAISQAICLYREQQKINGPLFLGMDTHTLSVPAVASALEVLAANRVDVMRQHRLEQQWGMLHFGDVKVETRGEQHVFEVQVGLSLTSTPRRCGSSFTPTASWVVPPCDRRCSALANWPVRRAVPFTARRCLRPAQQRTIRRASYRTATALRSHWKTHTSCGSDDPIDGRKDDAGVIHETR